MLPALPILQRAPHRSFFSGSHYNPHFLISRNAYRLREGAPGEITSTLEFGLTHIHENTHWFQHVGTTYGAFMDALRSSQKMSLLRGLRGLPRSKRRRLFDDRMKGGRPFIEIDAQTQYMKESRAVDPAIGIVKQIWFDHQWLHASFDDSKAVGKLGFPPVDACANVVADVILNCCDTHEFESSDFELGAHIDARRWYFEGESELSETLVELDGKIQHLTSTGLMECAASLNELQYLQDNAFSVIAPVEHQRIAQLRLEEFEKSSYSIPFKLYRETAKNACIPHEIFLLSLNLLIFFALNPPLPPRVLHRPSRSWRWEDVYPPHRFLAGLAILDQIDGIKDAEAITEMRRFIADISDASGLPYCGEASLPARRYTINDWNKESETPNSNMLIDDVLTTEAQFRLAGIADRLPLLANFASCLTGDLSRKFARVLFPDETRYDFLGPPLEFLKDGKIGFRGTAAFGNNIVRSVAVSAGFFEFACGTGVISFEDLPKEVDLDRKMFRFVKSQLRQMITETDNI